MNPRLFLIIEGTADAVSSASNALGHLPNQPLNA